MVEKNRVIVFAIIIAALVIIVAFLWKQSRQSPPAPIPLPSETTEDELKALQQQLDQLLELRKQLEK